ncbi:hypothetical protein NE237_005885 [Protea cynaroides]|uniref:Uncharacterized protein n=1 Tax=Protea cynaroides TaxID=273540 RepID=A0A9Q0KM33_9MAGN|nr:hypothetical protein NE237_005885 [Protea cynaroides]
MEVDDDDVSPKFADSPPPVCSLRRTVEKTARASYRLKGKAVPASSSKRSKKSSSPYINVSTTPIVSGLQFNSPVRSSLPPSLPGLFNSHGASHEGPSCPANERISSKLLKVSLFIPGFAILALFVDLFFFLFQYTNNLRDLFGIIDSLEARCARAELGRELVEDALKEEKERTKDQIGALREETWKFRQLIMVFEE